MEAELRCSQVGDGHAILHCTKCTLWNLSYSGRCALRRLRRITEYYNGRGIGSPGMNVDFMVDVILPP